MAELSPRSSVDPVGARLYKGADPWDIAQGYALAFGTLAVGRTVEQLDEAERRIASIDPLDPSVPPEVRSIAIDALARAQDRSRTAGRL